MQIEEIREVVQWSFAYLALAGLAASLFVLFWTSPAGAWFRRLLDCLWCKYRKTGAFGQILLAVFFIGVAQYGSTKGFWRRVQSGGGDQQLDVAGIYIAVSNIVEEVEGVPVTNRVPFCRIEYFGEATEETPVSVRPAETNEWTEVVKYDPVITQEAETNVLTFAFDTNLVSYAYWWFGVERPAIIVTEEGIELRSVSIGTREVSFSWVCGEAEATEFYIRKRRAGSSEWETVGEVQATHGVESWTGRLFTVDADCEWQIVTEIQEGGEN